MARSKSPLFSKRVLGGVLVLGLVSALFLRGTLVRAVLERATERVRDVAAVSPSAPLDPPLEVPPPEVESERVDATPAEPEARTGVRVTRPSESEASRRILAGGTRVSIERVLDWARRKRIPRARPRPAEGGLPAGLEIEGAHAWVAGILPRDRLVRVEGRAVSDPESVIGAVARARGAGKDYVTGTFARSTPAGVVEYEVRFEQPYAEDLPEPSR